MVVGSKNTQEWDNIIIWPTPTAGPEISTVLEGILRRGQALSLWSRSTDSKTLYYQRTNPREYQIVRIHRKETTWIQDPASPNHQQHPVQDASSKQQIKQTYQPNHQQTGLSPHSAMPNRGKTNKNSTQISYYTKLTQTSGPTLRGQKQKRRKNSTFFKERIQLSLKPWKRDLKQSNLKRK